MLQKFFISNPLDKKNLWDQFDPDRHTWVVSDLHSKFELQEMLLQKYPGIPDDCILRVSELWNKLFARSQSEYSVISKIFFNTRLQKWLKHNHPELSPIASRTMLSFLESAGATLIHKTLSETFEEWLLQNPQIAGKFSPWHQFSTEFLNELVSEKSIPQFLVSSYLDQIDSFTQHWDRELFVDVGADLKWQEATLFNRLSKKISVNVITPTPIWIKSFDFLTKPYDLLQESKKSELPTQGIANTTKCLRLATPLAESKWAVMQIREWLDSGVDPRQIAVHASQIEDYWVMLQPLLEAEGVLVFKNCVSKFSQLPVFQSLLAEFRLHIKSIDFVTLQNFLYSETPKIKKRFENFYAEFKNILDFEDVSKDKGLTLMLSQLNFDQKILNTDSFVKLLAAFWDKCRGDEGQLLSVVRSLLIEVPRDFEASLADWVYLLENLAAKIEVKIQLGDINGIRLTNLQSSDPSFQSHHIFLGLTEDQLKVKKGFGFSPLDLQKIAGDLGFYFDHPDQTSDEFSLKFNSAGAEICYFVCAENTVTGEALSPATDWLDQSRQNLETSPKYFHTVWDSKQQEYLNLQSSILADGDNYQLTNHNVREISVSGFERYQECAFNFKAERIFKLKDLPEQDLDTDRMTEGSIMHSVLEELSVIEDTKNVDKIVENIVNEKVPAFIAAPIRHSFIKRALLVASRFLKFQENLRSVASDFQIISREQKFKLQVKSSAGQDFTVIGKTDRIHALDSDKKITVIMDYKSSDQGFNLLKSALDKGQWQMVLYYLGLQQNSVNPTALQYYFYRSGDSKIVFKLKEFVTEALSLNAQAAMSQEDADSFFEKASEKLVQAVDKICRGELPTEPLNVNQCPQCEWNYLCRAQHLN